jgi:carbon-monoxide dehydrogenase small subunit
VSSHEIQFTVNGVHSRLVVAGHHTLLDVLRRQLELYGTNEGCRMGECGACTVWLDDRRVPACLILAPAVDGCAVTTIEGLAAAGRLHPMQEAFARHGALQCGFCTPGMIMSAVALLGEIPERPLSEDRLRQALTGNLCRCTGYVKIVEAILEVANR